MANKHKNTSPVTPTPEKVVVVVGDLPLYVTLIGTGNGFMKEGLEYPNTHRNVAIKVINSGFAKLKE